ncbi:MAG: DUF169 domain-containing protein [Oscillospiraceae bacterium]|jgi:uncharacterized protein (DUF169 family)|nr:DUF169 domain-containing protein [Oscillospiraceae bacterium]
MSSISEYNAFGAELEELLNLRYAPIALKLLRDEADAPEGAYRPRRDSGEHLALCQAFAAVRRQRKSIVMFREDNWCPWPLIGFGMVDFDESMELYDTTVTSTFIEDREKAREFFKTSYPRMDCGGDAGLALAPLRGANFEPDIVLIYCRPAQLRSLLMSAKFKSGELTASEFDSVDSCVHSTIPALKTGRYRITVPDPGEYERGLTDEDEMIFTVPAGKLGQLTEGLRAIASAGFGYRQLYMEMRSDFPRPQFYDDLCGHWGLDRGEVWKR